MASLGKRSKAGEKRTDNPVYPGGWVIAFGPDELGVRIPSEVFHIAIVGPSGSAFQVFLDTTFYDAVPRGDLNSWDPNQPMHVEPGTTIYFYFNTDRDPAPRASIFLREVSPI